MLLLSQAAGLVPPRDARSMGPAGLSNTSVPPNARAGLVEQLTVQAHAARESASRTKLRRSTLRCQVVEKTVALLIAADIRMNPNLDDRKGQVARLRAFALQANLFVHTDLAYAHDVQRYFGQATAVRYTEEEEDGVPDHFSAGPANSKRAGLMIQWWRLMRAWKLVRAYEDKCSHTHEFVMKIRTDMWINEPSRRPFRSIYHDIISSNFGRNSSVAFLSSDRFFGGSHKTFAKLAEFGAVWDSTYRDHLGICGKCDQFASALAQAETSTKAYEVALLTGLNRAKRADCVTLEVPPKCAKACKPAALRRFTYQACPVHTSDKARFVGAKKTLVSHSFGHGKSVLDFEGEELDRFRSRALPDAGGFACMMRWTARRAGGSEMSFVYHAFMSGLQIRSMTQLDTSIWSPQSHSLLPWRHTVHMWKDGFTVEDGLLQGYEIASNAQLGAELQLDPSRGVSRFRLVQAAAAAAMEVNAARLEKMPGGWGKTAAADGLVAPSELIADVRMPNSYNGDDDEDDEEEMKVAYSIDVRDTPFRHAVLGSGPEHAEFAEFVARPAVGLWPS